MSKSIYDEIAEKPILIYDNVDLFAANGTPLSSLGKAEFSIQFKDRVFKHSVVVIENFSYDFILGKDFLVANKAAIDFGISSLILPDLVVEFSLPKRKFIVSTVSDVQISAKATVAIQTKLFDNIENSDLFVEGGFAEDNKLFIARVLTKVRPHNDKVTLQVTNLADYPVFLPKSTEIAEVVPFIEEKEPRIDDAQTEVVNTDPNVSKNILSEEDLKINHLKQEEKDRLLALLRELKIVKCPDLGQVEIIKHKINVGDATPIKQPPYRVPLAKQRLIDEEVEKLLNNKEVVIAYASRQLRPSELKYATIQKECLAIVWGIKHFHYYLYGQPSFSVITDHCPLQWIKRMQAKNQMIQRWICELQGYSFNVLHRSGKSNGNADALSRCPITSSLEDTESCIKSWDVAVLDAVDVSGLQDEEQEMKEMKDYLSNGRLPNGIDDDRRKKIDSFSANYFLEDDVLYHRWTPKIYGNVCRTRKQLVVPSKERGKILMHCHNEQGHPGFMRTYSKIKENYFWITMKKDIARHCKNCKGCAKRKSPKNRKRVPLNPIESNAPLEIVGIDFVGPLPVTQNGNKYVMTFQDHFTRWPAAFPLKNATEIEVVECIRWFSRDFGYPSRILSDRGSAFLSDIVKRACKQLKIGHDKTSAYHPQANGLCERFHDTLKTSLSLVIDKGKNNWDSFVPDMVAAYRTTPHSVTKEAPCFLMFGRQFRVSPSIEFQAPTRLYTDDFLNERNNSLRQAYAIVRNLNRKERERHKTAYDKKYNVEQAEFKIGDSVYLKAGERKTGLDRNHWLGPYRVTEVVSKENVKLDMPDSNRHPVVNVNRLKRDKADDPVEMSKSIRKILDKMRTRNEKGRLETKYFVELANGETMWIADDHVSSHLLEDFKR
eukprot:gene17524-9148_t